MTWEELNSDLADAENDAFGVVVTYRTITGKSIDFDTGAFDDTTEVDSDVVCNAHVGPVSVDEFGDGRMMQRTVTVLASDVAQPTKGHTIVKGEVSWRVTEYESILEGSAWKLTVKRPLANIPK